MALKTNHRNEIMLEDVPRLLFRNFSGRPGTYNREGDRNFGVLLDPAWVDDMLDAGYPVKYLRPREEGDEPAPWIKVKVNFKSEFPPTVVMVTSRGRTTLDADTVDLLDNAYIVKADLVLNPYFYQVNDREGYSMYLSRAYITIEEDEFEQRYNTLPDTLEGESEEPTGVHFE